MPDVVVTVIAYLGTVLAVWIFTRRNPRLGPLWKRPFGILLRTAIVFLLTHGVFVGLGVSTGRGFLLILLGTYASMTTMLFIFPMAAAWIAYEWIFWFPTDGEEDPDPTEVLFQPRKVPEIVGKEGEAVEELKPTGRVRIDGKVYTAVSNNGWVDRGERVVVERSDGYGLTVTKRIGRNGG